MWTSRRKQVRIIAEDNDCCILWVSGNVAHIHQVIQWVGGFITPIHDDAMQYTCMGTRPVGNTDGDIIVILCDDATVIADNCYDDLVETKLSEWGVEYEI